MRLDSLYIGAKKKAVVSCHNSMNEWKHNRCMPGMGSSRDRTLCCMFGVFHAKLKLNIEGCAGQSLFLKLHYTKLMFQFQTKMEFWKSFECYHCIVLSIVEIKNVPFANTWIETYAPLAHLQMQLFMYIEFNRVSRLANKVQIENENRSAILIFKIFDTHASMAPLDSTVEWMHHLHVQIMRNIRLTSFLELMNDGKLNNATQQTGCQ